jgi:peptidoglycan/LPS O-acetylase OafA/YrhL
MVIVGHAYHLTGVGAPPAVWGIPVSTLAVYIFFSISGYLIFRSLNGSSSVWEYLRKRVLRILPGLTLVVLVAALLIGPAVSVLSVGEYFASPGWVEYLRNIIFSPVYALPGVFESVPYPNAVNGSLWTLPAEFACYLLVILALALPRKMRWIFCALAAAGLGITGVIMTQTATRIVVYGSSLGDATGVAVFFFAGALLAAVPAPKRWLRLDFALLLLAALTLCTMFAPEKAVFVSWVAIPYAVLAFGFAETPLIRRAGRFGDPSYGMYLWGFPVQQLLVLAFPTMPMRFSILIVIASSVVLGYLSWHLLEKPALRLGKRIRAVPPIVPNAVSDRGAVGEVPMSTASGK